MAKAFDLVSTLYYEQEFKAKDFVFLCLSFIADMEA
jgi:hypothetical protein